jgi:hypothetical protein
VKLVAIPAMLSESREYIRRMIADGPSSIASPTVRRASRDIRIRAIVPSAASVLARSTGIDFAGHDRTPRRIMLYAA